jgi:predicted nucleic acid-binding protein
MLDTGVLGLTYSKSTPKNPDPDPCRVWLAALIAGGTQILLPEIADYEARRELLRIELTTPGNAASRLKALDALKATLGFRPITSAAMLRAAELWAHIRRHGKPTAGNYDLDADAILAAQALEAGSAEDTLTIATTNVRHLNRFPGIDAREWHTIT